MNRKLSHYSLIVCICLALLSPAIVQAQFNCKTNRGAITIKQYTGSDSAVIVPGMINGLPVTSIEYGAFTNYNTLTSVTLPASVTSIEAGAFRNCSNLTSVNIPDGVTRIGFSAFFGTALTNVTIPGSVSNMETTAFAYCPSLKTITVEERNPFYSSMDGVLFNKHHISLVQFPGAKAGAYTIPGSVTNVESSSFIYCFGLTSVTIPGSVSRIGDSGFYQCFNLTNVTIGNGVTSIENNAFFGCVSLTGITIPDSVTYISDFTFAGCQSLVAITVGVGNSFYSTVDGVLFNKSQTTLVSYPGGKAAHYIIPGGVTRIGDDAFANSAGLTGVLVPDSVTSIGVNAFHECSNLRRVYFKGNAPRLDETSFSDDGLAIIYHLPGKQGWGGTFGGCPTALWKE